MRRLVQSRSVIGMLIALYLCAGLAAIPVPTVVVRLADHVGLSLMTQADATGCACGPASSCSSSDSCCCAPKGEAPIDLADTDTSSGFQLLGMSCQPELQWLLAAAPPVVSGDRARLIAFDALPGERLATPLTVSRSLTSLAIEPAPPRLSA